MNTQLTLRIHFSETASFANFVPGPNHNIITTMQSFLEQPQGNSLYLWGDSGTGKSHLLQAACQYTTERGKVPVYLPLSQLKQLDTEVLDGLDTLDLVCVDDVHSIAGITRWEEALFCLFNKLRDADVPQLISGTCIPADLTLTLPDLASRLSWGGVYHVQALSDEDKIEAVHIHAQALGLTLSKDIIIYLIQHYPRNMGSLVEGLQKLDYASLATHRKVTLPFVRHVLGISEHCTNNSH